MGPATALKAGSSLLSHGLGHLPSSLSGPLPSILACLSFLGPAALLSSPDDSMTLDLPLRDFVFFPYPPSHCLYLLPDTAPVPSGPSWAESPSSWPTVPPQGPRTQCLRWGPFLPFCSGASSFSLRGSAVPTSFPSFFYFSSLLNVNNHHGSPSGLKNSDLALLVHSRPPLWGVRLGRWVGPWRTLCSRLTHLTA